MTRVPVGGFPYTDADWRWSMAWFPVVGALLGAASGLVLVGLSSSLGATLAAAVMLVVSMLLTGGFHEDGLADTADGLGGGFTTERVLEILKDSRIGTYGAAALVMALFLRGAASAELARADQALWSVFSVVVLCQCLSRLFPVLIAWRMDYVTSDQAARSRLVTRAGWPQALLAVMLTTAVCVPLVASGGLLTEELLSSTFAGSAVSAVCAWRFKVRTGGVTGDFLGATQQISEVTMLLALVALRSA